MGSRHFFATRSEYFVLFSFKSRSELLFQLLCKAKNSIYKAKKHKK